MIWSKIWIFWGVDSENVGKASTNFNTNLSTSVPDIQSPVHSGSILAIEMRCCNAVVCPALSCRSRYGKLWFNKGPAPGQVWQWWIEVLSRALAAGTESNRCVQRAGQSKQNRYIKLEWTTESNRVTCTQIHIYLKMTEVSVLKY